MVSIQFQSLTHAGKAMTALRQQGISCKLEKATGKGCAYRLQVEAEQSKAEQLLRQAQVAFTLL